MSDDMQFERDVRRWIELGPDRAPERAVEAVLLAITTTPQERGRWAPWRYPRMNNLVRILVLAAAGLTIAAASLLLLPGGNNGPAPTSSPSASPALSSVALPPIDCPTPLAAGQIASLLGTRSASGSADGSPISTTSFPGAAGVAVTPEGIVYVSESNIHLIERVDLDGRVTGIVSGVNGDAGDGGQVADARVSWPVGLAFDSVGDLFVADFQAGRIRRIDPSGVITTVAGSGRTGSEGDGGPATNATINATQVSVGPRGDLYFDDMASFRHVDANGVMQAFAGHPSQTDGFGGDGGPALDATFGEVRGTAVVERNGVDTVYLADGGNHRVRFVDASGVITTIAGDGTAGGGGDGGPATKAQLDTPSSLALDGAGNLYIADAGTHSIRRIDPNGIITTIAGTGESGTSGDCGPATSAQFTTPFEVTVRGDLLYVTDADAHKVRVIRL